MSRRSQFCVIALIAASALASSAPRACAQSIRVRLLDAETRQPLAGVLVSVLGANGGAGPAVLASGDGIATVPATGAGPHRLLIRRIGFAPVITEPVTAPSGSGGTLDILVPVHRITLNTVRVFTSQPCSEQTESPSAGARAAWTEVRAALEASTLTRDQRLVTTAALRYRRELGIDGNVQFVDTTLRGRSGERPFIAPAPAALERDGYYRRHDDGTEEYNAPDEAALLSDGFTRLHCVSVAQDVRHDSTGTRIALAFAPRGRGSRPDIRGLIWIDSATSELRRIDFEYVSISFPAPADSIGGSVEFTHLASGAWIVSSWELRMPRWRLLNRRNASVVLDRYEEVGGTASVVRELATPGANVPRSIVGSVYDSIARGPLGGTRVHITDLGREVIADSTGAFRFDSVGVGVHTVWADHPTLDALGLFSLGARLDATPQAVTDVTLAIPSFATLWRRACGGDPAPRDGDGFVFGRVVFGDSARSPFGTTIHLSWRVLGADSATKSEAVQRSVRADSVGSYAICGVPRRNTLTVSAAADTAAMIPLSFEMGPAGIARRDIALSPSGAIQQALGDSSSAPPISTAAGATLVGVVRDTTGRPVRDVRVTVSGVAREWRTNGDGGFVLDGVPAGTRVIAASAPDVVSERRLVDFGAHDSLYLDLPVVRRAAIAHTRVLKVMSPDSLPVVYANVSVEGGATQITDEKGEVRLGAGKHQTLTVSVRRIGYRAWFGTLELPDTAAVVTVTLPRLAQALGTVTITGRAIKSPLELTGFYDRWMMRQKGVLSAVFIGPEEIEFRHPDMVTNMLRGLNGLCLMAAGSDPRKTAVFAYTGSQIALSHGGTCAKCPMAILVDGVQEYPPLGGYVWIDMILDANDVTAIEVYARGGNMPITLQANDTKCGVVALWTGSRKP